jgi:hypothetical protein
MLAHCLSLFVALGAEVPLEGLDSVGNSRGASEGGSRAQGLAARALGKTTSGGGRPLATAMETRRFSRLVPIGSSSTFGKPYDCYLDCGSR